MEDLNKNQIVLLTILISFVTSIATGIITVSLLQEAPIEVTRNINSIVEKTIERVTTPGIVTSGQKEVTTIVVKEEDSIVDSINKNVKSLVRIRQKDSITAASSFYGIGLIIAKEGTIMADRKTIVAGDIYTGTTNDGVELTLIPTGVERNTDIILFKATASEKTTYTFVPATFGDGEPKLGQTLISVGGDILNSITVGRVSLLTTKDGTLGTTTVKTLSGIDLDTPAKDLVDGSPLINLSGDIVGINLSPLASRLFTPIYIIKKQIATLATTTKSQ